MKRVYLDHNATTPLRPEVRELWLDRLDRLHGNPSSVHAAGRETRASLDAAREQVAAALGVHEDEIVFTSGGTESIHLALRGVLRAAGPAAGLLTTAVEHSAVLGLAEILAAEGRPVTRAPVDREGRVDADALATAAATSRPALVSVQTANNEIGTLQPLAGIAARLSELGNSRPLLHTDAVQAPGRVPFAPRALGVDLASLSAHKFGGPLGVGILYKRKGSSFTPATQGGGQEGGLRPGTENVPAIAAAALALELAVRDQATTAARQRELCASFWAQLRAYLPRTELHGPALDAPDRLPNTLNLALAAEDARTLDGRVLVARLDLEGLEVSAGSACASGSLEPSHVLLALGHSRDRARAAIRVSLGHATSPQDIHTAVEILRTTFLALR